MEGDSYDESNWQGYIVGGKKTIFDGQIECGRESLLKKVQLWELLISESSFLTKYVVT